MLADYFEYYWQIEPILELIVDCDEISALEELTNYDLIAAALQSLFGDDSLYPDMISEGFDDFESDSAFVLGALSFN